MKKISKLIAVMAVLSSVLMMSGCGIKDAIKQTYNTWYKYNGTMNIPLGTDSEDAETIANLQNAEVYVYYDEDKGLTVAVQAKQDQNVELFNGLVSYPVETVFGSVKEYSNEKALFGPTSWSALMILGNFKKSSEPKIVTGGTGVIEMENMLKNGIQWKKFLKRKLIDHLFDDD